MAEWQAKFTFEQFWTFTEPLEGGMAADCMFMVQDLQVAIGMGITFTNKANRDAGLAMAKSLQWAYKQGHPKSGQSCSPEDITRDYDTVLSMDSLGVQGPGHLAEWKKVTNCRITKEGLQTAVRNRAISNMAYLKNNRKDNKSLGAFDDFPADAQLCALSLSWAVGNEFGYPSFCKACRESNWFEAAKQCGFSDKVNTLPIRQAAQELMMRNAGYVTQGAGSPNTLNWPNELSSPPALAPLPGKWDVWIGNKGAGSAWNGIFRFDSTCGVSWAEKRFPQLETSGSWSVSNGQLSWSFRAIGDFRTFTVRLPLQPDEIKGTIQPQGQGWFSMSKM